MKRQSVSADGQEELATNQTTTVTIAGNVAATIADGADVALGAKGDSKATDSTSSWSVVALLKGLYSLLASFLTVYSEPDDTWTQTHVPATNVKATITQSAGAGALKNVCTGFTVTLCAGSTAPTAVQLTVALIDGASGGGTYLWRSVISLPATAGAISAFIRTGKFIGSAATAMTLEFSAAGGANTFESVTMKGYQK